jgi:hypothetical protein
MNDAKYIGMDVQQATISAAVRDSAGNLLCRNASSVPAGRNLIRKTLADSEGLNLSRRRGSLP